MKVPLKCRFVFLFPMAGEGMLGGNWVGLGDGGGEVKFVVMIHY